ELLVLQQIKEHDECNLLPVIVLADDSVFSALEEKQQGNLYTARVIKPFSGFDLLSVLAEQLSVTLVYENDGETVAIDQQDIVPPPKEELEALLLKVRQGDVAGISQLISSLFLLDAGKYKEFAALVEGLAEDFQLNMIADLIKRYGISQ
ncbi:MAG: hypothetical protein D3910_02560, partial [Candidatus Electrothrix sp. ATG2]|nr:hypothetical protein [Candidatus Electrothrix sp. ATG2]